MFIHKLWSRIREPKAVSILYFSTYLLGTGAGAYAIVNPPGSIAGRIGTTSMIAIAVLLTFGCLVGAVSALPGIYWLERSAVASIGLASLIYLTTLVVLHVQQPGNRMLQSWFVFTVLAMQAVRWVRIRERPYRPVGARE